MAVIDDIILIQMQRPGIDGSGITDPEKAQLVNDVAAALSRPNITSLGAVPDVSGAPSAGQVLVRNAANSQWEPRTLTTGIAIVRDGSTTVSEVAATMEFRAGLAVTASASGGTVYPEVVFGGGGASNAAARSDHPHTLRADVPLRFDASGALSSGSRTLASGTVSGLEPSLTYVLTAHLSGDLRGGGTGAGYTMPSVTIGGNTRQRFGEVRTVSGVDRDYDMKHPGQTVSGVTSVTVGASIAYRSGDPINVGAGELVIEIRANR